MPSSLKTIYDDLCNKGELDPDAEQIKALSDLDALRQELLFVHGNKSFCRLILNTFKTPKLIKGIYIYGPVGRGKSILMDLFFVHTNVPHKKRVHFHKFMQDVHQRLHAQQQTVTKAPLEDLADQLAQEFTLICFDEFLVEHIGDAMILKRLFELLFQRGIVMVATSNVAPKDLYKGGFQRELFEPFIKRLTSHTHIIHLEGPEDYRKRAEQKKGHRLFTPLDTPAKKALQTAYNDLTGKETTPITIQEKTRKFEVLGVEKNVLWITFEELCSKPRGAKDYLFLSAQYQTWILSDVPLLLPDQFNEAKRFQTLVDILYEQNINLWMSAETPLSLLYTRGRGHETFKRTTSRLTEMLNT